MRITTLAQWFGGNRMLAESVGKALGRLRWCGVPFAGGCPELPHIDTAAGVANDLHRHVINLARVVRDDALVEQLVQRLDGLLFHPDELITAQRRCRERERLDANRSPADVEWAADYFAACWMGRGGHAGKRGEFDQGLSLRWTSSGGDSAVRFRSAIQSLRDWHRALRIWSFSCFDAFEFIANVRDADGHGLYVDAPWPDAGEDYQHSFTREQQIKLAEALARFERARIVVRYGDHPLIRDLYPQPRWTWLRQTSRNQRNGTLAEILIVGGGPPT
ncbi:MAG: DNA adenine methylase [Phycisphaerae bacterium]|nr:DNA adenine methylase [Phycisphaerae bacterium]